jgi:two-component sensor histidine kinase
MARGWESKSVEAQIEERKSDPSIQNNSKPASQEEVHERIRKDNLQLSRKRILQQLEASTNERYSEMLRRSLAELDGQLESV